MIIKMLLVGAGLVVNAADRVPNLDVKSTCAAAIEMTGPTGRTVQSCLDGEMAAHKDLEKNWLKFPSGERTQCVATSAGGSPSFVELLVCLEMMGDSRKHREEERAASKTKKLSSKP
jgi:hypothetical protein